MRVCVTACARFNAAARDVCTAACCQQPRTLQYDEARERSVLSIFGCGDNYRLKTKRSAESASKSSSSRSHQRTANGAVRRVPREVLRERAGAVIAIGERRAVAVGVLVVHVVGVVQGDVRVVARAVH